MGIIAGIDYVRLFNDSLVAQHSEVVVLDIVPELSLSPDRMPSKA